MQRVFMSRIVGVVVLLSMLLPGRTGPVALAESDATADDEIIYIDSGNYIRVIDPNVGEGTQQIQWSSPDNSWYDFAAGDFNNDGDKEIVAIGGGRLTVFDPVVQDGAITPDGEYNLVPWVRLHERALGGADIVGAGNLDQNAPGDEIVVGYNVNEANGTKYRVDVLKTSDGGRTWTTHISQGFGAKWTYIKVGNIDNQGSDDLLMARTTAGDSLVVTHQVDNNFASIFSRSDSTLFTQRDGAIGQVYAGGTGEVVLLRTYNGTDQAPTLFLYRFVNGHWPPIDDPNKEIESETNFPHPFDIVTGDVNGNGDDEIVWLREAPVGDSTTLRLVLVNRGSDTSLPAFVSPMDADNGYRVLAMGDPDGDGRKEVAAMRNNRIRYFYAVETGNTALFTDFDGILTNSRSLQMANLDGTGYTAGARFSASPTSISASLEAGTVKIQNLSIQLSNVGSGGNLPITVSKEGSSSWFNFSLGSSTTPASIFVTQFDASTLEPGTYRDRLVVTSSNGNVLNQPFYIPIELIVTPASFSLNPTSFTAVMPQSEPKTESRYVAVNGLPGLTFTAAILGQPEFSEAARTLGNKPTRAYFTESGSLVLGSGSQEFTTSLTRSVQDSRAASANEWPSGVPGATASSAGVIAPDTITVVVSSTQMTSDVAFGVLLVMADERAGSFPDNLKSSEFMLLRTNTAAYLPVIAR